MHSTANSLLFICNYMYLKFPTKKIITIKVLVPTCNFLIPCSNIRFQWIFEKSTSKYFDNADIFHLYDSILIHQFACLVIVISSLIVSHEIEKTVEIVTYPDEIIIHTGFSTLCIFGADITILFLVIIYKFHVYSIETAMSHQINDRSAKNISKFVSFW